MARRRYTTKHDYNMDVREQTPFESDIDYYRSLARQANARMSRIENAASKGDQMAKNMLKYAYRSAQYDIHQIAGADTANRFSMDIKETKSGEINQRALHKSINAVKQFLEAPSSTKTGLKAVYEQRARTINQRYGYEIGPDGKRHRRKDWKNLTWQDMAKYYESDRAAKDDSGYGSSTEVRALGAIKRIANKPELIKQALKGNYKLSNNDAINKAANLMIQNGLDPAILKDVK